MNLYAQMSVVNSKWFSLAGEEWISGAALLKFYGVKIDPAPNLTGESHDTALSDVWNTK